MSGPSRGNILFLILLAVVLFAALSYAVTQSLRGGGNDAGNEKASTQASDLLNYFTQLDSGVQRMMLTNNVKDYELNFYYQNASKYVYGIQDNTNCTSSRCRVFDPVGGGVTGRDTIAFTRNPPTAVVDTVQVPRIMYIGVPGVGTSAPDIVINVQGISEKMCRDINAKAGVTDIISGTYPITGNIMYQGVIPVGPIPDIGQTIPSLPLSAALAGTFCTCRQYADWPSCTSNVFYPQVFHVLVAR